MKDLVSLAQENIDTLPTPVIPDYFIINFPSALTAMAARQDLLQVLSCENLAAD